MILATSVILLSGCGDAIQRVGVSGQVTLDGQPLEQGSITLLPLQGGPSAGGKIVDGSFEIDKQAGPSPGDYRVEIVSYQSTGRTIPDPDVPGEMIEETRQMLPARYNHSSELEASVRGDEENEFRFELNSAR